MLTMHVKKKTALESWLVKINLAKKLKNLYNVHVVSLNIHVDNMLTMHVKKEEDSIKIMIG